VTSTLFVLAIGVILGQTQHRGTGGRDREALAGTEAADPDESVTSAVRGRVSYLAEG
jgi:hypothetical protein